MTWGNFAPFSKEVFLFWRNGFVFALSSGGRVGVGVRGLRGGVSPGCVPAGGGVVNESRRSAQSRDSLLSVS